MKTKKEIKKKFQDMMKLRAKITQRDNRYLTLKLRIQLEILRWVLED